MLQSQDSHGFEARVQDEGVESDQAAHPVAPVESDQDDAALDSESPTRAGGEDIYRGMDLLVTPGKDVDAARAATLR